MTSTDTINALLAPLGLKTTHAFDGIHFVEHNLFLVLDSKDDGLLLLCFNQDCPPDKAALAALTLYSRASELDLELGLSGTYTMEELPGQEIKLHFHPQQTVKESHGGNGLTH
ncbi:hypothetical protein NNJEOMEG_03035 [Fundidesulfovibrio magnetotacticus]|uniref:Uncharacterized protein n=1 Tax=Fundidesulfovibrio magnetotacticus TaxID=2730080 RepID=A0A6V8LZY0_9BACT|nr:hypothetical protein [Fundidesulfovibrio magnetotacticus]GFK95177.1 hypothetical protein NNJEOMEG_03035 [Fundidesulfovibrio magnetotacticus]